MISDTKKIVVVGGGTAGWITALKAKTSYPDLEITVIESKDIGILGAGEGSTPYFLEFFDHLNIPLSDLVKNCDATIKNGIKFTNWNNDGNFYYHSFSAVDPILGFNAVFNRFLSTVPVMVASIAVNNNFRKIDFTEKISEKNKVPFSLKNNITKENTINDYENLSRFSIHFNATKLANRLKEIAIERGIKHIEGTISDIVLDHNNNVSSLILENNLTIPSDFVFDCSGFHRLIIGKVYNSKWKSYKDFLPVDSAVPFFIEMTEDIPPYTEAIAMKHGWIWKIPLQTRFGCGYVYDSSLISESEAINEIEEFLGYEPIYPRKNKGGFKFSAGCYEESWINNCIAIGPAANFVEPLEATSIWVSMMSLAKVFDDPLWLFGNSYEIRKEFNEKVVEINTDVSNFIYFHYMTLRKDTEFWQKFSYENAPKELKEKIDIWQHRLPNKFDVSQQWSTHSWILLGVEHGTINKSLANMYLENSNDYRKTVDTLEHLVNYQNYKSKECIDHKSFLEEIK